jgi:intracellular septation protein
MSTKPGPDRSAEETEIGRPELIKLAIELGPLVVFLAVWLISGIMSATGAIMVTSLVAMIVSQRLLGRVSPALVTSTVLVVAFGALTLALDDTRFIMLKPTMVYLLFAAAIGIGLLVRKPVLQLLLGDTLKLTETGWRLLSIRWAGFFVAMAVLNEIVRLSLDERAWVLFKVAGFPILTLVFVIAQARLMTEHRITDGA